jgi:DNA topoisomerase-2
MRSNKEEQLLSQKYQKKTDHQHILDNPDTYIGSIEKIESMEWVVCESEDNMKMEEKQIEFIPGLYKLFDEGIVNCRDHSIRMKTIENKKTEEDGKKEEEHYLVSSIQIKIEEDGTIIMSNDGDGIDIIKHPEYDVWIPELIFGHLRTSTNYDKNEKKIVGGKNGFGFKLVLIWSTYGSVETVDAKRKLKYKQEFKNNLTEILPPVITHYKQKPYTKITFRPDYERLGCKMTEEFICLLKKRACDISALTDKSIKVKWNEKVIPIKNFEQYVDLYIGSKNEKQRIYEHSGERWEYIITQSEENEFKQISFVNGIYTSKGGKHVDYIVNQVINKVIEYVEKKKKIKISPISVKQQIFIFLRCDIENPSFDSQTKDYMNTPITKFGSTSKVSDTFIEKICKMGIMNSICELSRLKDEKNEKKLNGVKTKTIQGIPKLTDANWAGTSKSKECILILCEGDSAKAGILSGLTFEDRNYIGVYPMKGKMLNVRCQPQVKINENKEITEIKKILGLKSGTNYLTKEDVHTQLRYAKVIFMTDQDLDGTHIKGLGINLFHAKWKSLTEIPEFIGFMNTPILKAQKGNTSISFYNEGEYDNWKKENCALEKWKIKYYKGLGTSTSVEFKEYMRNRKIVYFEHMGETSDNAIEMAFDKKRIEDRKEWIKRSNDKISFVDTSLKKISYENFIDNEFVHFSKYDCERNIPNIMDGFKTTLRKILYCAFKRNLTTEIKVAQFSGYISEHSCYHHGEASLHSSIIGMAQDFVGTNNIPLFVPAGQFGTRLLGGSDAASERYIFTCLQKITKYIFHKDDINILSYLEEDGLQIEPTYYVPILPMILINGSKGIGTGFSTEIYPYHPLQIIENLQSRLKHKEDKNGIVNENHWIPYFEGFQGKVIPLTNQKFLIKGCFEKISNQKICIQELPIGTWIIPYKEFLEQLVIDKKDMIKDIIDQSTDSVVMFTIQFQNEQLEKLEDSEIERIFKLTSTISTTNMHLFDSHLKLKKYESIDDIIDEFYERRLSFYDKRKSYLLSSLKEELIYLQNKVSFLTELLNHTIDLRNKPNVEIEKILTEKNYKMINNDIHYSYLVNMPMNSVSSENKDKLIDLKNKKKMEYDLINKKTIYELWNDDLSTLYQFILNNKK